MGGEKLPDAFVQQLAALRREFGAALPLRVKELATIWESLDHQDVSWEALRTLHRLAHSLAGSGSTFGFGALSREARRLEEILEVVVGSEEPPASFRREEIARCIAALGDLAALASEERGRGASVPVFPATPDEVGADVNLIYVADNDPSTAQELIPQLQRYGYRVRTFVDPSALPAAVAAAPPAAVLLEVDFPSGPLAGPVAVRELRRTSAEHVPVVFVSARADLAARVEAARAGGDGYLVKPVEVNQLVERLEALARRAPEDASTVLVVESSSAHAHRHDAALRGAGMLVTTLADPTQVMRALSENRPDLVLLDLDLPDYSGIEVAAAIRQKEECLGIPIVLLAAEGAVETRLGALRVGADDLLTEPVESAHLVTAIRARVERSRALRSRMVRDGLTRLLNHTAISEQLAREVALAARKQSTLAVALLDLDHLKAVNDACGHETGDRVLQALANMLRRWLRSTDVVGRYGGGSFVAVLPGTDGPTAVPILDELREKFSHLEHDLAGREPTTTLSCGVAWFPLFGEPVALMEGAEEALKRAKDQGRNRTVLAGDPNLLPEIVVVDDGFENREPKTGPRPEAAPTARQLVVVIDDEPKILQLVQVLLTENGYAVLTAKSGVSGYDLVVKESPDAVVSDVLLPGLNGFDLCKRIKGNPDLAGTPVILMSAVYKTTRYRYHADDAGADALVAKPLDPAALVRTLRSVLETRGKQGRA